ncbi:hypothetical protein [Streptomyces parvulus]|uniref:hypothetical protein n=1 Tax=Streptomyces parvulus TaxID=146923 RepID=UPI00382A7DC8
MAQSTDLRARADQGITNEHMACAAWVLASIAVKYRGEDAGGPVDTLDFTVRVGAKAYELVGQSCHGGAPAISRVARAMAGEIADGMTRGALAGRLDEAARELGCEWDGDVPRLPQIPGPRGLRAVGR